MVRGVMSNSRESSEIVQVGGMRGLAVYVNVNYDGLEQSSSLSESIHESQRAPIAVSLGRRTARARPRPAGGRWRQMDPHAAAVRAGPHQPLAAARRDRRPPGLDGGRLR